MKSHDLKCWIPYFEEIVKNRKKFEVRKNDRDFEVDDILILHEWDNERGEYTGMAVVKEVTYILHGPQFGIEDGYVVMSIQ